METNGGDPIARQETFRLVGPCEKAVRIVSARRRPALLSPSARPPTMPELVEAYMMEIARALDRIQYYASWAATGTEPIPGGGTDGRKT